MPKNAGNLINELHFFFNFLGGMPPDPPRRHVPLALAIKRLRPSLLRYNLPLFQLHFQFFNLHLPVLPKSGLALAALDPGSSLSSQLAQAHYLSYRPLFPFCSCGLSTATIEYSSACVCVCVCLCVCLSVCL